MLASAGPVPRYATLLAATMLLQVTVAAHLTVFGYVVDLLLVVAVVGGLVGGPSHGTTIGCAAGVCTDLLVHTPFGMWMLCGVLVGYISGQLASRLVELGVVFQSVVTGFAAATGLGLFIVLAALLGVDHVVDGNLAPLVLVVFVSSMALAPLAFRVTRWALALSPEMAVAA